LIDSLTNEGVFQEFQYSHLILCTGTDGPFPGKYTALSSYQMAIESYQDLLGQVTCKL